jgi:hypothetical protein
MDFSFLLLFIGMFIARRKAKDRGWLARHQTLGLVGPALLLVAFGVALTMVSLEGGGHFRVPHAFVGAGALLLSLVMPVLGFSMLKPGGNRAKLRRVHVWLGRATLVVLAAGALTGLFSAGLL